MQFFLRCFGKLPNSIYSGNIFITFLYLWSSWQLVTFASSVHIHAFLHICLALPLRRAHPPSNLYYIRQSVNIIKLILHLSLRFCGFFSLVIEGYSVRYEVYT